MSWRLLHARDLAASPVAPGLPTPPSIRHRRERAWPQRRLGRSPARRQSTLHAASSPRTSPPIRRDHVGGIQGTNPESERRSRVQGRSGSGVAGRRTSKAWVARNRTLNLRIKRTPFDVPALFVLFACAVMGRVPETFSSRSCRHVRQSSPGSVDGSVDAISSQGVAILSAWQRRSNVNSTISSGVTNGRTTSTAASCGS
jgi:hypothetical protein